jgi:hypothetical protein
MILICYDGSPDSRAAVEQAAELFADRPATVLTVWQPFAEMAARLSMGFGLVPLSPPPDEIDAASRKAVTVVGQRVSRGAPARGSRRRRRSVAGGGRLARSGSAPHHSDLGGPTSRGWRRAQRRRAPP